MLWFNFILGLNFTSLCFKLIIIYYHAPKQREIKFKPRIKLNHNIDKRCHVSMSCFVEACSNPILSVKLIFFFIVLKIKGKLPEGRRRRGKVESNYDISNEEENFMEPRNTSPVPTPVACTTYSKPISLWSGRFRL